MKIKEIGEFGFIAGVAKKFTSLIPQDFMGIGDDCALLPLGEEYDYVITTDLLVENVHFLMDRISPEELGSKALAVNLSDLAAMGAQPVGSFLSIGFPPTTELSVVERIMDGYHHLSAGTATPLLGGDTTSSPNGILINVAVVGRCPKGTAKLRSTAKPGDIICVTGFLGDSAGGLKVLLDGLAPSPLHDALVSSHHNPRPHLQEGSWLAACKGVHAMMDISDGIASDLLHIVKASKVKAEIELSALPVSDRLQEASKLNGWNIDWLATSGGEDYVLLVTIDPTEFAIVSERFRNQFAFDLYAIGTILERAQEEENQPLVAWKREGCLINWKPGGYNHFTE